MELIPSACKISGNLCIVNDAVAVSRGEDEKEIQKIIIVVKPEPLPKPHEKPKPGHKEKNDDSMNNLDYDGWYQGGVHTEHAYEGGYTEAGSKSGGGKSSPEVGLGSGRNLSADANLFKEPVPWNDLTENANKTRVEPDSRFIQVVNVGD